MAELIGAQKAFIETTNKNLLVSASAGSGKTFTMVKKVVSLIKSGVDIENLLVITYSNAAGAELKTKISEEILNEINDNASNNELCSYLFNQLEKINVANIGTLHSFCKNLITKYFYKLNISPSFKVLVGSEWDYLFNQVIENVFVQYTANKDDEFYKVYENFSAKRNVTKLKDIIKKIHTFMVASENVNNWFENVCAKQFNENVNDNVSATFLKNLVVENFTVIENNLKTLKKQMQILNCLKYENCVNEYLNAVSSIARSSNFSNLTNAVFQDFEFHAKPRVTKDMPPEALDFDEMLALTIKNVKDEIKKAKNILVTQNNQTFAESVIALKNLVEKLYEIATKVLEEFNTIKLDKNYVDFADMERQTLKLLENELVRTEISDSFKYIFVDEYQDINYVQEEIISKIKKENNLNMIGDVKQSIYAFRLCSPEIFVNKYNLFKSNASLGEALELNNNFRSSNAILQFSNFIFNKLANEKTIGINYEKNAQLTCGNEHFKIENEKLVASPKVHILINDNISSEQSVEQEALFAANEIKNLLSKKFLNSKTGKYQFYKYSDIAIISRDSSGYAKAVYSVFKNLNIPINIKLKTNIFKSAEVKIIYSFLKLANNFFDDVALATVLLSPICKLNENHLISIRKQNLNEQFCLIVKNYKIYNLSEEVVSVIEQLFKELENFKLQLLLNPVINVVENFIYKYNLINFFKSEKGGSTSEINIMAFLNLLNIESYKYNLGAFLNYVKNFENSEDNEIKIATNSNAVTVCTMHASKGLEWPAVIVLGAGKKFNENVLKDEVIVSREFGIGAKVVLNTNSRVKTKTLALNACALNAINNEHKENIRLFYVALTRAKNNLSIVGSASLNSIKFVANENPLKLNRFLDYLLFPLSTTEINKLNSTNILTIDYRNFGFEYVVYDNLLEETDINNSKNIILKEKHCVETEQIVNNILKLKNIKSSGIAVKNTVTGILVEDDDYENLQLNVSDFRVNLNYDSENNSAMQLGTAYHKIIENLNFLSENNVYEIINSLTKTNADVAACANQISVSLVEQCESQIKLLITPNCKVLKEAQFLLSDVHSALINGSTDNANVLVQGVVDLIIINGNEATVVDFKTNKNYNENHLKNLYSTQLNLYAKAVENAFNVKVTKKLIYAVMGGKFVVVK